MDLTPHENEPEPFNEIDENKYVCRSRKTNLSEDEVFECKCDPRKNQFCERGCMNRMSSTECNSNYCLVGDKCRNQRFQNKEWSLVEILKAGKKGWGLYAQQDIEKDQFVIEYCGEIINQIQVKQRLKEIYFGSKKFFILSLGGGELIDATIYGSKARLV